MKKLVIISAAIVLVTFGFAKVAHAEPTISKELTFVTGPANTDPVPQGAGQPTTYEFTINYDS